MYHEILSNLMHIGVNILRPTEKNPFHMVYTTGMDDKPMTLPDELADREDLKYAEVFLFLPGDWDLGKEFQLGSNVKPEYFWPLQMLKFLARFPPQVPDLAGSGAYHLLNGPGYVPFGSEVGFGGVVLDQLGGKLE